MFDRWITLGLAFLPSIMAALAILLIGGGLAALTDRLPIAGRSGRS
jgi:hypothetical protein